MMPPWPKIFSSDAERKRSFGDAPSGYGTLLRTYEGFDIRLFSLPKLDVGTRADFV